MKEAEKILNKFIKGDIARDYDEASRKHHTITLQTALEAINIALSKPNVSGSLLERAMLTLDDYLNAGCKKTRKQAAENAKFIYKEYYGVDYVNRNDR